VHEATSGGKRKDDPQIAQISGSALLHLRIDLTDHTYLPKQFSER
jgi:hypothetical protein